jgi:hypothetical protein
MTCIPLSSISCLAAKQRPGCYPRKIAMSVIYGPPAECNRPLHACLIILGAKKMITRADKDNWESRVTCVVVWRNCESIIMYLALPEQRIQQVSQKWDIPTASRWCPLI